MVSSGSYFPSLVVINLVTLGTAPLLGWFQGTTLEGVAYGGGGCGRGTSSPRKARVKSHEETIHRFQQKYVKADDADMIGTDMTDMEIIKTSFYSSLRRISTSDGEQVDPL